MSLVQQKNEGSGGVLPAGKALPPEINASASTAESLGPEGRGAQRFTLLVRSAKLIVDGREYLCVLRDASSTGVKLRLFHPMPRGEAMALELANGERHPMKLRWQADDHAGFQFDTAIDVKALIDDRGKYPKRQIRLNLNHDVVMCAHNREFTASLGCQSALNIDPLIGV